MAADVYLLACLGRPDLWPIGDRALQVAAAEALGLPAVPDPASLTALGERWRPLRSTAARLLWHGYLSRRGRVWSYTDGRYRPPSPYVSDPELPWEPYALIAVELAEERLVVLGQAVPGVTVADLAVGMEVEEDSRLYTVTDVAGGKVVLDGNHPLAGMALRFSCVILAVRQATKEELNRGVSLPQGG